MDGTSRQGSFDSNSSDLRPADLVAKTARVTLKDTLRVMRSVLLVAEHLDCNVEDLLGAPCDLTRPSSLHSEACDLTFRQMCKRLNDVGRGREVRLLRSIGMSAPELQRQPNQAIAHGGSTHGTV